MPSFKIFNIKSLKNKKTTSLIFNNKNNKISSLILELLKKLKSSYNYLISDKLFSKDNLFERIPIFGDESFPQKIFTDIFSFDNDNKYSSSELSRVITNIFFSNKEHKDFLTNDTLNEDHCSNSEYNGTTIFIDCEKIDTIINDKLLMKIINSKNMNIVIVTNTINKYHVKHFDYLFFKDFYEPEVLYEIISDMNIFSSTKISEELDYKNNIVVVDIEKKSLFQFEIGNSNEEIKLENTKEKHNCSISGEYKYINGLYNSAKDDFFGGKNKSLDSDKTSGLNVVGTMINETISGILDFFDFGNNSTNVNTDDEKSSNKSNDQIELDNLSKSDKDKYTFDTFSNLFIEGGELYKNDDLLEKIIENQNYIMNQNEEIKLLLHKFKNDHSDKYKIKIFSLNEFSSNSKILILGNMDDKTAVAKMIKENMNDRFFIVFNSSNSYKKNKNTYVYDKYSHDYVSDVLNKSVNNDKIGILIDSVGGFNKNTLENNNFKYIMNNSCVSTGKHVTMILTLIPENMSVLPVQFLSKFDYIFISRSVDVDILKRIYNSFVDLGIRELFTYEDFKLTYGCVNSKNEIMVIKNGKEFFVIKESL